jgi:hypothetical protein
VYPPSAVSLQIVPGILEEYMFRRISRTPQFEHLELSLKFQVRAVYKIPIAFPFHRDMPVRCAVTCLNFNTNNTFLQHGKLYEFY